MFTHGIVDATSKRHLLVAGVIANFTNHLGLVIKFLSDTMLGLVLMRDLEVSGGTLTFAD